MAIFGKLTDAEIYAEFTHVGMFCGLVPVYMTLDDTPNVAVKNGYPDFLLDIVSFIWQVANMAASYTDPNFEPGFNFDVIGEIDKGDVK